MFDFDGLSRLRELEPHGERVLVRADLDCPLSPDGEIIDPSKAHSAVETLRFLLDCKARVLVAAHQSARDAANVPYSLEACGALLAERLNADVLLPDEAEGPMARKLIGEQREGTIVLLENLARDPRETAGDDALAHALASGIDLYVGDCLPGPAHYTSLSALPRLCKDRTLGLRAERELVAANELLRTPASSFLLVLGGTFEQQRPLLRWALRPGRTVLVGGPLAATLLAATGEPMGRTPIEDNLLAEARTWLELARKEGTEVVLPSDFVVVGEHLSGHTKLRRTGELHKLDRAMDLGPDSVEQLGERALQAKSVLMVGTLGLARHHTAADTDAQRLLCATPTFSAFVHDSLDARAAMTISASGGTTFVSTAADAFIEVVCGKKVPTVETLRTLG